ncbi:MAG: site-2 protease family protein [Oscillospiraceae bacterium]|nr:site-2 protease family protein [Oscillospiraceae bacterium]
MVYILLAILIFGILIGLHELGHFAVAKACGVKVNEFSIGMGPLLFQKKKGETDYSLRLFPIGGFCAMEGEDDESEDPRALNHQPFWKQFLIIIAGAAMNFITGLLILLCLYAGAAAFYTNEIVALNDGFPSAGEDGIMVGDEIFKINGERIYLRNDVATVLQYKSQGDTLELVVLRDGKKLERTLHKQTYTDENGNEYRAFGFSYGNVVEATPLLKLKYTWYNAIDYVRLVRMSLQMLITGTAGVKDLSGPVGIVSTISEMGQETEAEAGFAAALENVLFFGAMIAVNLAVMNLLPLPALDGGKILILIVDEIAMLLFKKKIPQKFEAVINAVGFVALMGLMLFVTFNDVSKLVK